MKLLVLTLVATFAILSNASAAKLNLMLAEGQPAECKDLGIEDQYSLTLKNNYIAQFVSSDSSKPGLKVYKEDSEWVSKLGVTEYAYGNSSTVITTFAIAESMNKFWYNKVATSSSKSEEVTLRCYGTVEVLRTAP